LIDCLDNSHDHEGLRAPRIRGHTTQIRLRSVTSRAGRIYRCPAKIEDSLWRPGTVRNYLSAAVRKLGAANRHEAVHIAAAKGWI
jgi:hypothetical protein